MRFNQSIPEMLNNIVTIENKLTPFQASSRKLE